MISTREAAAATRRAGILSAARRVFLRESYSGTSMEAVAQEAGVSKQTVYNHFGSKEELFRELVYSRCKHLSSMLAKRASGDDDDPEQVLTHFGETILAVMLAEESMDLYRLLQAEGRSHPQLAEGFYELGPERTAKWLAEYLAGQTRRGRLHVRHPRIAAEQFVTMLVGHLRVRHLLGLAGTPSESERRRYVRSAVRIFLDGTLAR